MLIGFSPYGEMDVFSKASMFDSRKRRVKNSGRTCVIHKLAIIARITYALEMTIYGLEKIIYGLEGIFAE